jgi:hypothetical protein
MLEILLWTPFITQTVAVAGGMYIPFFSSNDDGETKLCIDSIFEDRALRLGEANGGLPDRYAGNSAKLTSRPEATRNVLKSLAAENLAGANEEASNVVLKCLNCQFTSATDILQAMEEVP